MDEEVSEYTPITGELRKYATVAWDPWPEARDRLYQMCDAIDAVHVQLERENAALKNSAAHAYVSGYEHAEQDRDGWMELPKDVDGVPIRVGDTVEYVDDTIAPRNVTSINLAGDGWWVYINGVGRRPDKYRHVTPDTWERIIEDARTCTGSAGNYTSVPSMRWTNEVDALVARCKALCERTKGDA